MDIHRPIQPQGHNLPREPLSPASPPLISDPGNDPQPAPSDPTSFPAVQPAPFDPTPTDPAPFNPSYPITSSSSESSERLGYKRQPPSVAGVFDSSSEEVGGPVARRPPFNFRYQRRDRRKRQALMETPATHSPAFLSDFPSSLSPFRSCPGPARYTTV